MTDDAGAFGTRLCACRQLAGLSQEELAERSGLSVRAIGNLERGNAKWPHPDSIRRLADALGLRGQARGHFFAAAGRRLAHDAAVVADAGQEPGSNRAGGLVVPRQLPCPVAQFVGRLGELAALTGLLDQAGRPPAAVISAIGGTAGVGKTALAVYWAHEVANRFPDGQLYLNLRGFDPSGRPVPSVEAIRFLLDALQVPAEQIPAGLDAQAGLYRSLLSGRRMLLVLDNARDAAQVRPLLPGSPGCLVLVTSRRQLSGLVAGEGAWTLSLGPMTEAEARELLARRLGAARMTAETGAAAELIDLCARLPLALALAAARALACPGLRLDRLADELRDALGRLDALETGDAKTSLRAVFSWSAGSLPTPAARMFGLIGLHPGPDITIPAAASLAGIPPPLARRALRELADAHLVIERAPGRFAMHDLLRAYAAEHAESTSDEAARRAAVSRTLDHYLQTAQAAALLLSPSRPPIRLAAPYDGVTAERLSSYQQAMAWFEAEHQVLLGVAARAAETRSGTCAWQLPWTMADFLDRRGYWQEWADLQRTALTAATCLEDTAGQAAARRAISSACVRLGDYDQAHDHLIASLRLYRQLGDRSGQARVYQALGRVAGSQGRLADALSYDQRALEEFRASGDRAGEAVALNSVGWYHILLDNPQTARTFCRQAIVLHRDAGDLAGQAYAWDSLGYAEHKLGRLDHAVACYQRALSIFCDLGDRFGESETLARLGDTREAAADSVGAKEAWQRALDILSELHHPGAAPLRAKLRLLDWACAPLRSTAPVM